MTKNEIPGVTPTPKPELPKTAKEQLTPAQRKEAVETLISDINELDEQLAENLYKDFEEIAKNLGYDVTQTEFFSKSAPPKELMAFIQNSRIGKLSDSAFLLPEEGDSDEKVSDAPYQTEDGWYVIRLDEVQAATPLSYEEAKVKVTIDLKKKMAREAMVAEAKELEEKITKALEAGKSFQEAAKELEQTTTDFKDLGESPSFNIQGQMRKFQEDPPAYLAAQFTNPGKLAPLTFTPSEEAADKALIIFVTKREVIKDEQYLTGLDQEFEGITGSIRYVAFSNWLYDRFLESNVVPPSTVQ